jgi:peptidoglycan-associated lipoprotein
MEGHHTKDNKHASSSLEPSGNLLAGAGLVDQGVQGGIGKVEDQEFSPKDTEFIEGELSDKVWAEDDSRLQDWGNGMFSDGDYLHARQRAEYRTEDVGVRDIYFQFDSWRLTPEAKDVLSANAEWLKGHTRDQVTIEGHCDERGTQAYNYALGAKRANIAKNYLISLGVLPVQINSTSYGKDKPQCQKFTEGCFQKNRRAHMIVGIDVVSRNTQSAMLRVLPEK